MSDLYLVHSAKGSTWKKHKYIRKEGNKYIYVENDKKDMDFFDKISAEINDADYVERRLQDLVNDYNKKQDQLDKFNSQNFRPNSIEETALKKKRVLTTRRELKGLESMMKRYEDIANKRLYNKSLY